MTVIRPDLYVAQDLLFRVSRFAFRVSGFGFRVSGFGLEFFSYSLQPNSLQPFYDAEDEYQDDERYQ